MNERASVLCKILCFQKMEGWVNISQPAEWDKLQEFKADYDLKVKLWVNEKVIQEGLRGLIQLDWEKGDRLGFKWFVFNFWLI